MGCKESKELGEEMLEAIENKDKIKVQNLVEEQDKIDDLLYEDPTFGQCAAVHLAAKHGCWDIVHMLLKEGADFHVETSRGLTPLTAALVSGQDEVAFQLLTPSGGVKGVADMNRENSKGLTPILIAILYKRDVAVEMLMRMEADLTHISSKGGTKGLTALLVAIHKQFQEAVDILIEGGAPLDAKGNMGQAPLVFAAERNNEKAVVALLDAGADPEGLTVVSNNEDVSLWTWAARNAYQDVLDILPPEKKDDEEEKKDDD